jgi:hypothetical protein
VEVVKSVAIAPSVVVTLLISYQVEVVKSVDAARAMPPSSHSVESKHTARIDKGERCRVRVRVRVRVG